MSTTGIEEALTEKKLKAIHDGYLRILGEIGKVIVGQEGIVTDLLTALLAGGHVLVIGVPGLAKTLLIRTLAAVLDSEFKRIQFTPDLMPSDVTGTDILQIDPQTGARSLRFVKGPIFTHVMLADEINRTPPKTQAALLEAMQEHTVTTAGTTHRIEPPFFVVATQNPIEQEGTYPLPEAQLDRFLMSLHIGYPSIDEETRIATLEPEEAAREVKFVFSRDEILECHRMVRRVPISPHVVSYAVALTRSSRPEDPLAPPSVRKYVEWGGSPRATQHLILAGKARTLLQGRPAVSAEEIRTVAPAVLRHRVIPNYTATGEGIGTKEIVAEILRETKEADYE